VNTAAYSPRPSTPAAEWDNQVADLIKMDRLHQINALVNEIAEQRSARYLNTVQEVLVEGVNPKIPTQMMGRNGGNRSTFFDGDAGMIGQILKVHVDESRTWSLTGHLVV